MSQITQVKSTLRKQRVKSILATIFIASGGGGSGSVTSVGGFSPLFTVANPTTTPTFTAINQSANIVFAGPSSGIAAAPTFRALVSGDIPSLSGLYLPLVGGTLTQPDAAAGWTPIITFIPGINTALTSTQEFNSYDFKGANWTWVAGTIPVQRFAYFRAFTVTTGLASDAYGLYVDTPLGNITRSWGIGTNGNIVSESSTGKITFNTGGNQIGMQFNSTLKIGWISSGAGNSVDFVDNGGSTTMARFTGGQAGASSFAFNTTTITNATFFISQPGISSSHKPAFRIDPGAHTAITTTAELNAYDFRGSNFTWAAGTIPTQRFTYFRAFTVTTGLATTAYGVYIEAPNGNITNAYALGLAGRLIVLGDILLTGSITFVNANQTINLPENLVASTTNGTKFGTATSQKFSFWNATPIIQPTTAIAAATFVTNTSLIANDTATFDGYTIGQVVKALRNTGLLA